MSSCGKRWAYSWTSCTARPENSNSGLPPGDRPGAASVAGGDTTALGAPFAHKLLLLLLLLLLPLAGGDAVAAAAASSDMLGFSTTACMRQY